MKNSKRIIASALFILMAFAISPIQADAAVKISAKKKTLTVGQSVTLKIKGTKKKVKWSSSNKQVATVSSKGKVKTKKVGTATITAKVAKKKYTCKITVKSNNVNPDNTPSDNNNNSTTKEKDYSNKIKILSEYTLPDGINWYTRHFMIVKNTSDVTVDISTSSIAYSSDGSMISAAEASEYAIGAGCTTVIYEPFETSEEISYYKTDLKAKESKYYKSVIEDLDYTQNNIKEGVIFQVKNNGNYAAKFVEGYALFFLNGELVEYDTAFFTDDDYEIKPGSTITEQFTAYKNFDKVEFYLTGRR